MPDEAYDVEPTVLRLSALGVLDPTFGEGGEALIPVRGRQVLHDVALQPDGKIVAVGGSETPTAAYLDWEKRDFGVYRLETTGRPDSTFATSGVQRTDWYGELDDAKALALASDGRITVGGYVRRVDGAVARYLGDPASPRPDDPMPLPEDPTLPPDPPGNDPEPPPAPSEGAQEPAPPVGSSEPAPRPTGNTAAPPAAPGPDGDLTPASPFPAPAVELVRLEMTKRGVRVTLRCVSSSPCRGRISVKHRGTKVGKTGFGLRVGVVKRLTMRIASRRLRQLRRRDGLRLVVRVDLTGAKSRQWRPIVAR